MNNTVYLLGAGINRGLVDWHGLRPPLADDLFQQALKLPYYEEGNHLELLEPLFDYIQKFWKLTIEQLKNARFDLEACYTLIQLQISEAKLKGDKDTAKLLYDIEYILTTFFARHLAEFRGVYRSSDSFDEFAKMIYQDKSSVLTFNYDTLLESAIESASGHSEYRPATHSQEIRDEDLIDRHYEWNIPLAYGVEFDQVDLHRAGSYPLVPRERFYNHPLNKLYEPPFLKLHGSINWFTYTGISASQFADDTVREDNLGKTIIYRSAHYDHRFKPEIDGEIIQPVIVTPVLNKEIYQRPIIPEIWKLAFKELSTCKKLIVGGYSFPATDFNTKRLFLEAFANHTLEELIVINPDTSVVKLVKDLCHFKKPVLTCHDLDEFVGFYK